jgi:hypothetical protein
MRIGFLAVAIALSGCSAAVKAANGGGCTVTLSGAVTQTLACTTGPAGVYTTSNSQGAFLFQVAATASTPDVNVAIGFPGDVHTGTFMDTDTGANSGLTVKNQANNTWLATVGSGAKQGSYTLLITGTGLSVATSSGKGYSGMGGTLDAVLPFVAGSGATGNVNMHVSY